MVPRYLQPLIEQLCFSDHRMAFVSGPRQVGKTTLARQLLASRGAGAYCNWDDVVFRRLWARDPRLAVPQTEGAVPVVVFDEIHKARQWKRSLKGIFDTLTFPVDIVVTGSARLNVYRRGSDSLVGRYFHFRLHPLSMAELLRVSPPEPDALLDALFADEPEVPAEAESLLDRLLTFGGFPQPFLAADTRKANLWRRSRVERIIREDLRDLSRIPELSRVEMLAALIAERVGAPLSRTSLRELLEVSFDTVRRWIALLDELYYLFEVKPWRRSLTRSLRREGKVYLWDWSEVTDEAARFENLVASHLLKVCHYWTDAGFGRFDLHCLRTRDGQEIDFLISRDNRPWLPVEVKTAEVQPSSSWPYFGERLKLDRGIQLVRRAGFRQVHQFGERRLLVIDAAAALGLLV